MQKSKTINSWNIEIQIKRKSIRITKKNNIYKVNKPWGYELWLNGRHKNYSFKKYFLKKF